MWQQVPLAVSLPPEAAPLFPHRVPPSLCPPLISPATKTLPDGSVYRGAVKPPLLSSAEPSTSSKASSCGTDALHGTVGTPKDGVGPHRIGPSISLSMALEILSTFSIPYKDAHTAGAHCLNSEK